MEQITIWEANSFSANQQIPSGFWNANGHWRRHNCLPFAICSCPDTN